ncbi:MAG TPA: flagellar biosynthesis protein FlhB [Planctomycetota bacterium]|nr:flagellar biosynthesis protein FlhB [Planctomycetota bacterium]
MAESPSGGEKSEYPTPKRLEEARLDGQVSFSAEVNIATLLLIGFCTLAAIAPSAWTSMAAMMRLAMGDALHWELDSRETMRAFAEQLLMSAGWLGPLLGVLFFSGLGLSIAQVGLRFTGKPLVPKLNRISPLTGFQRLFGMRGLMRFVVNLLKLTGVVLLAWYLLSADIPRMITMKHDAAERVGVESWCIFVLVMKLAAVLFIIAAGDFIFQRYQHTQDLMMTKQEIKEEIKQSEGDPLVKSKIRQIQRQIAQRRMMQEVPKADVVITNPTHVAVALKYDKATMAAPVVLARGYDEVAQRIKAIAAEHGIVQVENIALARALAKELDVGDAVPVKWYQAVAEVLSMVYKLKKPAA